MADTVHDDQLAEAFTQFRSEVRGEIRPPGAYAVRKAARRRRTVRVACAAAAVALVGAAVAIVTAVDSPDTTVSPTLSEAELEELATEALRTLFAKEPFAFGFPTAVTAQTRGEPYALSHAGSSPGRFVEGDDYDLVALCLGPGTVTVAWEAPGGVTGSTPVVCGGDSVRVRFTPRADGPSVLIRFTPDAEATGRAGIGVAVIEFH